MTPIFGAGVILIRLTADRGDRNLVSLSHLQVVLGPGAPSLESAPAAT